MQQFKAIQGVCGERGRKKKETPFEFRPRPPLKENRLEPSRPLSGPSGPVTPRTQPMSRFQVSHSHQVSLALQTRGRRRISARAVMARPCISNSLPIRSDSDCAMKYGVRRQSNEKPPFSCHFGVREISRISQPPAPGILLKSAPNLQKGLLMQHSAVSGPLALDWLNSEGAPARIRLGTSLSIIQAAHVLCLRKERGRDVRFVRMGNQLRTSPYHAESSYGASRAGSQLRSRNNATRRKR